MTNIVTDHFGLPIPSALPTTDQQEFEVLHALGRLELLRVDQIRTAFFPHMTEAAVRTRMEHLLEDGVVWRTRARFVPIEQASKGKGKGSSPARRKEWLQHPYVYGLTHAGKELLKTVEVVGDEANFSRLKSRDVEKEGLPDPRTLSHDLQVSWWVLNLILEASRNRLCRSIYAQVEFIPEKRQRIDALVILRLSPSRPRKPEEIGPIPWFDGTPCAPDEIDIRLALEVDRGTEELIVLLNKGAAYRELSLNGIYTKVLGGLVLPVFVVQATKSYLTLSRVRQIATEYRDIWPRGWGVISTPLGASNPDAGVLWGQYRTLIDDTAFPLLTELRVDRDGRLFYVPVCDLQTWLDHREIKPVNLSREQLAGRAGSQVRWDKVLEPDVDSEVPDETAE